jgi:hypothetical protein
VALSLLLKAVVAYGMTVKIDYDKDYDFGKLKAFAFKEQSRSTSDLLRTDSLLDNRIKDALRSYSGFHFSVPVTSQKKHS